MTRYKPRTVRISALAMTTRRIFFELPRLGSVGAGAIELRVEAPGAKALAGAAMPARTERAIRADTMVFMAVLLSSGWELAVFELVGEP
jgi:hypothetical protein